MFQVIPKWHVVITFPDNTIEFWAFDHSMANVQQLIAKLQWSQNGLQQPSRLVIEPAIEPSIQQQIGAVMTTSHSQFP